MSTVDLAAYLKINPFALAPMAGITDLCFRSFMRELGAGAVITELVSAHGIEYKSGRTLSLMAFSEDQRPIGVQLFGETPEILADAARVVEQMGADFVDLNFGCPVPKVVKKGAGSAILKDLPQVERVFRAVKGATSLPVTVKIRTGWDAESRNAEQVAQLAYNEGLSWVAIHGRTRAAGYSGLADWDYIAQVKAKSQIPIIGNGDIHSAESAMKRMKESGVDGVMIGRGCLKNPWIFREAMNLWTLDSAQKRSAEKSNHSTLVPLKSQELVRGRQLAPVDRDFVQLFYNLRAAFERTTDLRITMLQIKKFASWFSSGYPGASNFRKAIFQMQTLDEAMDLTIAFFEGLKSLDQADTSHEEFLMGGHG